jgi:hypothetical protein
MGNYVHSKQFYASVKRREVNRLIDAAKQTAAQQQSPEIAFVKRGGTQRPTNDLPADKQASAFQYALDEQKFAMSMFPEAKSVGEALSKWYATPVGKATITARLRDDYEEGQKRAALGAPMGSDDLIYGSWRSAVQNDSPRPIGTASPTQDGLMSASPNDGVMSHSAADGSPPAVSGAYVGKIDADWIRALCKGAYAPVREKLRAMKRWSDDEIDCALIRHERGW